MHFDSGFIQSVYSDDPNSVLYFFSSIIGYDVARPDLHKSGAGLFQDDNGYFRRITTEFNSPHGNLFDIAVREGDSVQNSPIMLARTDYSVLFVRDTNDDSTATVDEPATLMMLLAGLAGLVMRRKSAS